MRKSCSNKDRKGHKDTSCAPRELIMKEESTAYGKVLAMLGNGRCEVKCLDGVVRIGRIRGSLRNKVPNNLLRCGSAKTI